MTYRSLVGLPFLCLILATAGCGPKPPQAAPAEAPAVPVSKPVSRQVTD
jgi:hypothetical protein